MRLATLAFLLAACGGGGGCTFGEETFLYAASVEFPTGRVTPGFRVVRNCDDVRLEDDYGLEATGQRAFEDWQSDYIGSTGTGECGCVDWVTPTLVPGTEVLDYRTGEFVLLETEDDVEAFLNR